MIDYIKDKKESYSYILGLYLGDGYINLSERTYRLRIALDTKYQKVIKECEDNLIILFPNNKVNNIIRKETTTYVYVYSNKLPLLFPQHGVGKKSSRKIELFDW
jgi:predicted AlkP superfamily phosphohydrolase/phosphomutase